MAYVSTVTASRELAQPEREIAHYLERIGGKFTDGVEREIEMRFLDQRR
jgi:hypothetical protein